MASENEAGATPLLSVIIPVFNREKLLPRTLRSILSQTVQDFELIIVDNLSSDGSREIARNILSGRPQSIIIGEEKRGAAAARNAGLKVAKGNWILFFDSDDVMTPNHIERVVSSIMLHPNADIIGWDIDIRLLDRRRRKGVFTVKDPLYRNLMNGSMSTQRYCARAELFRKAGGWDENTGTWDDIELGMRLLKLCSRSVKIPRHKGCTVILSEDSLSNNETASKIDCLEPALQAMEKSLGPDRKIWLELKRMILAGVSTRNGDKAGEKLRNDILRRTPSLTLRIAYLLSSRGVPGVARLLRPFIK